jgi:hypothetical protein
VRVFFTGGPQGFDMFIEALADEGIEVGYERPVERRQTGAAVVVHAVLWLLDNAASAAVGVVVGAGYERARAKVQARFPRTRIEVDPPERDRGGSSSG